MAEFSENVWEIVRTVPKGKVTTYKEVAERIGAGSPRSVGQALKRNTLPVIVPCHRVVMSDGRIGGYYGGEKRKIMEKARLLESEGVKIRNCRVDLKEHMHRPD